MYERPSYTPFRQKIDGSRAHNIILPPQRVKSEVDASGWVALLYQDALVGMGAISRMHAHTLLERYEAN